MKLDTAGHPSSEENSLILEATQYEERALIALRDNGYRITMPRVQVIRALGDTRHALSAYAIHKKVISEGGKIDVVSVYRILATLQELNLVYFVGTIQGYFPSRLRKADDTRALIVVCKTCNSTHELPLSNQANEMMTQAATKAEMPTTHLKVEIQSSTCPNCKAS